MHNMALNLAPFGRWTLRDRKGVTAKVSGLYFPPFFSAPPIRQENKSDVYRAA